MPKVKTLKFDLQGQQLHVHINVDSSGNFSANIPEVVATPLNMKSRLYSKNMGEIERDITSAIDRFKKAETKEELYILVRYAANGEYTKDKNGVGLFHFRSEWYLEAHSFGSGLSCVGFDFEICIKETIDTVPTWYQAKQGKTFDNFPSEREELKVPEKWFKTTRMRYTEKYKTIPYTDAAFKTLKSAQEKLRVASETLYKFINQDEEAISLFLNNQKLLT